MYSFGNYQQGTEMPFSQWQPNYFVCMNNKEVQQEKTIQTLKNYVDHLTEEINTMKMVLRQVVIKLDEKESTQGSRSNMNQPGNDVGSEHRKALQKHLVCPHEGCEKRYSSRIALNCHLRTKHEGRRPQI